MAVRWGRMAEEDQQPDHRVNSVPQSAAAVLDECERPFRLEDVRSASFPVVAGGRGSERLLRVDSDTWRRDPDWRQPVITRRTTP